MKHHSYRIVLFTLVLALFLSGCDAVLPLLNPSPTFTATPMPPPAETARPLTKTPIPTPTETLIPTDTFTPEPTLSPTITLTYTPTTVKVPAEAHFRGDFEDGFLEFDISADGRHVENLKIVIRRATKCQDGKRLGIDYRIYLPYRILINEYGFPTVFGILSFRGWFSTFNSTAGDFILTKLEVDGRNPCTIGPISWIAWIEY